MSNATKTHCIRSHEFTPANTYTSMTRGVPMRQCRRCRAERQRVSRAQTPARTATKTPEEMDAAVLRRLREAWAEGVANADLCERFGKATVARMAGVAR